MGVLTYENWHGAKSRYCLECYQPTYLAECCGYKTVTQSKGRCDKVPSETVAWYAENLTELLSNGPRTASEIREAAKNANMSWSWIYTLAMELGFICSNGLYCLPPDHPLKS